MDSLGDTSGLQPNSDPVALSVRPKAIFDRTDFRFIYIQLNQVLRR